MWLSISPGPAEKAGPLLARIRIGLGFESFYDETNDRSLRLSDEQGNILKSYFQAVSADAIARITVGMTHHQVNQILIVPGTFVSELGGYKYFCDDGSAYIISYVVDEEISTLFVTSIIKVEPEASPEA